MLKIILKEILIIIINNNFNNGNFDNGNFNNKNYSNNPFENAKNVLNDFLRKGIKFITKGDLNNILIKNIRSEDIGKVVKKLLDDGFLMEDGRKLFDLLMFYFN